MFAKTLSLLAAVALVVSAAPLDVASIAGPLGESAGMRMPGPIYRYANQHFVVIGQVLNECWDYQQSDDDGETWTTIETVCEPVGFAD